MKRIAIILLVSLLPTVQAQERVIIHWWVWISQTNNTALEAYEAIAAEYNTSQNEIQLEVEFFDSVPDVLVNPLYYVPIDIVGPISTSLRALYPNAWLDLSPYIEESQYDVRDFDPALLDFYRQSGHQLAVPLNVYPSFMLYNRTLFDTARIPYPPRAYGEVYIDWNGQEREWNIDTLRELAVMLTIDANGNDGGAENLDPENIVQFGFGNQYAEMRGRDTLFGSGSLVDTSGNAVIPENWRAAENWYHQAMWEDYFYPNADYAFSELLNSGNWFASGNIAMVLNHSWYLGWGTDGLAADWDFAPVPAYRGQTTAKIHEDSFYIWRETQFPDESFRVLSYFLSEKALAFSSIYDGIPARQSLQDPFLEAYIAQLSEDYPTTNWASLNWEVVFEGIQYAENPSHEAEIPNSYDANERLRSYIEIVDNGAEADVNAELDLLELDLQTIFEDEP